MMYFRNLMGGKFEIPENAIIYIPTYGRKLTLSDPNIIKHQYNSGTGYVTYNSDTLSTVFRRQGITSITLPPTITTLEEYAFDNCSNLTTLTLPNTITESRNYTFDRCSQLKHVHIPDLSSWLKIKYTYNSGHPFWAVTSGDLYINGEKLTDITIPEDITTIRFSAFRNCKSLTNITIPNHVTAIGRLAFDGCDITKIVIPDSVVTISDKIFRDCTKLKEVTLPQSLTAITEQMFYNCTALESIVIPESVTTIGAEAFYKCNPYNLKSINIPESVTTIDVDAFNLYIPSTQSTGSFAGVFNVYIKDLSSWCKIDFGNASSNPVSSYQGKLYVNDVLLTELVIPEDITEIKNYTFAKTGLKKVTIHDNVTSIGNSAFSGCQLNEITFGRNITSIGSNIYYSCDKINIPNLEWLFNINYASTHDLYYNHKGTIYIDNQPINDIVIPENVTKINDYIFKNNNNITSINMHNEVTTIGKYSFYGMSALNSVTIGNKVTHIGNYAFGYDKALTSISIPSSVIEIGNYAFYDVTSLESVHITDLEAWLRITFDSYVSNPVYNYQATLYLNGQELTDLVIPESITELKSYAFYNHKALTSITIPNSGIHINYKALYGTSLNAIHVNDLHAWCNTTFQDSYSYPSKPCSIYLNGEQITTFVVPDDVEQINSYLFYYYDKEVILGKSIKSIGTSAFAYSTITQMVLPDGLETIGNSTFYRCTQLKSINIPTTLNFIGDQAFSECNNLERVDIADISSWCNIDFFSSVSNPVRPITQVYLNGSLLSDLIIPNDITQIKNNTFVNFPITSVLMHDDIISIGNYSFYGCDNLTTVHIPNKVTSIGSYAFTRCTSLSQIIIPDSVITLGDSVFSYCENLEYVKIGNGIEIITAYAFNNCTSLKTIVLSSSVKNILSGSMNGCTSLESIYIKSDTVVTPSSSDPIPNNENLKIYVPFDLVDAYNKTYPWSRYNIIGFDFENNDI